jgi:glutathione S-transferase
MKLHGVTFSPFVQRVLFAARVKGVELDVAPLGGPALQSPEFGAISPMRRIPVLEAEDGWTLCESSAIIAYLDETQPGPSLLPADPRMAAKARQIAGLVDTEVAAGLRHFVVQQLFRVYDNPGALDYGRQQTELGLDAVERIGLNRDGWAVGDAPSIADAALIPFLTLGELICEVAPNPPVMSGRASIDDYWQRIKSTPLGGRSYTQMRDGFAQAMQARRAVS